MSNLSNKELQNKGIRLLKKGQKGIIHAMFSRLGLIILLLVIQGLALFGVFIWFSQFLPHIIGGVALYSIIMVLYILNSRMDPTAKITWLVIMMILPVFGAMLFWFTKSEIGHIATKKRVEQVIEETGNELSQNQDILEKLKQDNPGAASLATYLNRSHCHPIYDQTEVEYFPLGENKWVEMLKQLEQAKDFIFLEYFIVDEGLMWGTVLDVLARKAKEGVEIRMLYDGTCEFSLLPHNYPKKLAELGIHCKVFAPFTPFVSTHYNYRDHRKIMVIDGKVAFTGGVNLADEYINTRELHGHWKDTAIMLKGEAVKSFTLMFLQMWSLDEKTLDFDRFLNAPAPSNPNTSGYVIPYGDCPLDEDRVGEMVYMDILNRATDYVHIMSPYLILDGEMETALKFSAERGVDVKLILPGIPDKHSPYALARTHYASLLDSGVKIYEYTPGFVHAKVFVSDDREGVVGTINLDYRSLYHHFECASWMYDTPVLQTIEKDFQETLANCRVVTYDTIKSQKWYEKLLGIVLKVVAPLM